VSREIRVSKHAQAPTGRRKTGGRRCNRGQVVCKLGARRLRSGGVYKPGLEIISAPKSDLAVGNFTRIRQLRNLDLALGELNQIFDEFKIFDQVFIQ
jgi:hypothetical protein